jgi:hypothetical protein
VFRSNQSSYWVGYYCPMLVVLLVPLLFKFVLPSPSINLTHTNTHKPTHKHIHTQSNTHTHKRTHTHTSFNANLKRISRSTTLTSKSCWTVAALQMTKRTTNRNPHNVVSLLLFLLWFPWTLFVRCIAKKNIYLEIKLPKSSM